MSKKTERKERQELVGKILNKAGDRIISEIQGNELKGVQVALVASYKDDFKAHERLSNVGVHCADSEGSFDDYKLLLYSLDLVGGMFSNMLDVEGDSPVTIARKRVKFANEMSELIMLNVDEKLGVLKALIDGIRNGYVMHKGGIDRDTAIKEVEKIIKKVVLSTKNRGG